MFLILNSLQNLDKGTDKIVKMEETKNNENENMWGSCQFGIDKSKFRSTENTRQSINHLSKNRKLYTVI